MASEKPEFLDTERSQTVRPTHNFMRPNTFERPTVTTPSHTEARHHTPLSPEGGKRAARFFDGLLTFSLVALFFGFPIFFLGLTYQGITFEKQLYFYFWLLLGLIAWVSRAVMTGEMRIRRTPLDIPIIAFWLFSIVSAVFAVDRWHSFWGFFGDPSRGVVSITALVLFYYLLLSHFTPKRLQWMLGALTASGILVSLWSTLVVLKIPFLPATLQTYAPLSLTGSVGTLTTYLGVLLPLFMASLFLLWQSDGIQKARRTAATVALGLGILLSLFLLLALYQYAAWLVILAGLAFFLIYILAQIVRPHEGLAWLPMAVFVVVLVFLMIGTNSLARANLPVEVSPSLKLSWVVAKESLSEHFLVGVGPADYGYAFSLYHPAEYNQNQLYTLRFYQSKGLFFESLATLGGIGTILFVIALLSYLSVGVYLLSLEKSRNKITSLGLLTAALMLLLAGVSTPFNGTLLILWGLISALALGALLWESGLEEKYLQLSLKASPKFALALAFIFMVVSAGVAFLFVFMGKVLVADIEAGRAVRLSAQAPSQDSASLLTRAINRYPQEGRYFTRLGQEYMALANQAVSLPADQQNEDQIVSNIRTAVAAGETGRNRMPNDALAVESLALIYENAGLYASDALPKALEQYQRAQELEPQNPLYDVKIGQIKRAQADAAEAAAKLPLLDESEAALRKAIEKKENLALAHYQLALTLSRQQNYDAAMDEIRAAIKYDPNNVNYQYNLGVVYQLKGGNENFTQAESVFKGILDKNERLIDVRLSLALLYERENKDDAAIAEYRKILDYLPRDGGDNIARTREQVQQLITNVQNGTGNLGTPGASQSGTSPQAQTPPPTPTETPVVETTAPPVQTGPQNPNQSPLVPETP
ncbi:MAG: tetratricopeptide repeat protein [Candidatus Moraniibacteriota bacterium]